MVRQGGSRQAQRKDHRSALEIRRAGERRRWPAHQSLCSRRRPPADHSDEPPDSQPDWKDATTAGTGSGCFKSPSPYAHRPLLAATPAASSPQALKGQSEVRRPPQPSLLGQELLDASDDHLEGDPVLSPFGHDDVGPPLGRLDELLMHGANRGHVLAQNVFEAAAPFAHIPA